MSECVGDIYTLSAPIPATESEEAATTGNGVEAQVRPLPPSVSQMAPYSPIGHQV